MFVSDRDQTATRDSISSKVNVDIAYFVYAIRHAV